MNRLAALLLLLSGGLSLVSAQDGDSEEGEAPAPAEKEKPRDPFTPSDRMRKSAGERFVPADAPARLPALQLRGFVEDAEGRSVALLEVEGSTYVVRKDDTVNLPRANRSLVLRVVDLANLELRIEIGELRRIVVVR